jgi:hypothetical protein
MTGDLVRDHWLETYKSLITIAIEGFKYLALINGGAIVVLLAYLGDVAGKSPPVPSPDMRLPVAAFITGLAFCGIALLGSYITQLKLLNEIGKPDKPPTPHGVVLWVTIYVYLASLIAFGVGAWTAVVRFQCNT